MQMTRSKWFLPSFAVALGVVGFVAYAIGGDPSEGLVAFAIVGVFGAIVLLGGRSETIRGLRGDARDERFAQIDLRATAATGMVLIVVLVVAFLVEVARGHSGNPYAWLGAIAGLAYALSVAFLRWRG